MKTCRVITLQLHEVHSPTYRVLKPRAGRGRKEDAARMIQVLDLPQYSSQGFPGGASGKEPAHQCRRRKRRGFDPWVGKIP